MKLLVIGGTVFVGRALVDDAIARGWDVTTFNRGTSGRDRPEVQAVHGDRTSDTDLAQLANSDWDAVVDTCGFVPRVVGASARLLAQRTKTYAFISTIGAHRDWPAEVVDEMAPLHDCAADSGPDDGDYSTLKAGCERAVVEAYGMDRSLLIRPGLIIGPYENIGRLPWWLLRVAEGGQLLGPGPDPDRQIQVIDARDVARFTLDAIEHGLSGPYNVASRTGTSTWGSLLAACIDATGSSAEVVWVTDDFLLDAGVEVWEELPLWSPVSDGPHVWDASVDRAHEAGLRCRPITDTVRDTWAILARGEGFAPPRAGRSAVGLDRDKERRILQTWLAANASSA